MSLPHTDYRGFHWPAYIPIDEIMPTVTEIYEQLMMFEREP